MSSSVRDEISQCVKRAKMEGYIGVVYFYHQSTKRIVVNWTNPETEDHVRCDAEQFLFNIFTAKSDVKDEPVVGLTVEPTFEEIMMEEVDDTNRGVEAGFDAELAVTYDEGCSTIEDGDVTQQSADQSLTEDMFLPQSEQLKVTSGDGAEELSGSKFNFLEEVYPTPAGNPLVKDWMVSSVRHKTTLIRSGNMPMFKKLNSITSTEKWVSKACEEKINNAVKTSDNLVCHFCQQRSITKRRLIVHVRQHFTKFFCRCGYNSSSREVVLRHQNKGGHKGPIYEVSESLYSNWVKHVGLENPPFFSKCVPTSCHNFRSGKPKMLHDLQARSLNTEPQQSATPNLSHPLPVLTKHGYPNSSTAQEFSLIDESQSDKTNHSHARNTGQVPATSTALQHIPQQQDPATYTNVRTHGTVPGNTNSINHDDMSNSLLSTYFSDNTSIPTATNSLTALANQLNLLTENTPNKPKPPSATTTSSIIPTSYGSNSVLHTDSVPSNTTSVVSVPSNTISVSDSQNEHASQPTKSLPHPNVTLAGVGPTNKFAQTLKLSIEAMESQIVTLRQAADQLEVVVKQQKLQLQIILGS